MTAPNLARQSGSATTEFALVLPLLVAALLVLAGVGAGIGTHIVACEAARVAATQVAVGEPASLAQSRGATVGSEIKIEVSTEAETVRVSATKPLPQVLSWTGLNATCQVRVPRWE